MAASGRQTSSHDRERPTTKTQEFKRKGRRIKRKDLLKEEDNAARTKKQSWNDREKPTTKTHEFKRKGRRIKRKELLKEEDNAATKKQRIKIE